MGSPSTIQQAESTASDPGGFAHIPSLDGLRGLAIALIVIHHLVSGNPQSNSSVIGFFVAIRETMWVGVDLFFALSGFLITGILFDSLVTRHPLRKFYGRRLVRIFPLYYLALVVLWLMTSYYRIQWNGFQWDLLTYLQNTPLWIGRDVPVSLATYTGHLWSLALEEQFYLFWPFVVLWIRDRRRLMNVALALSLAALALRIFLVGRNYPVEYTYKMLPCRMDSLLLGGWLALAVRGPERGRIMKLCRPVLLIAAVALLIEAAREHGLDWQSSRFVNSAGYTLITIVCTALIGLTLNSAGLLSRRIFTLGWLRSLGKYSYGIYVWHMILGRLPIAPARSLAGHFTSSKLVLLLTGGASAIVFSVLLGVLSYHLYEVHWLRLKRYFAYTAE